MIEIYYNIDLNGSDLQSIGNTSTQWTISLQMSTTLVPSAIPYQGVLTVYIDDGIKLVSIYYVTVQEPDDQSSSGLGFVGVILLAIFIPLFVVGSICFCCYQSGKMVCSYCWLRPRQPAGLVYNTQQPSGEVPNPMVNVIQGTVSIPMAKAVVVV